MSAWFEEKLSPAFRDRVEHRAFQAIDTASELESRRTNWRTIFSFATGLSVASLVGILIARRNSEIEPKSEGIPDMLALDILEESNSADFDLLADLELFENFDDLSEISEDDLAKEKV